MFYDISVQRRLVPQELRIQKPQKEEERQSWVNRSEARTVQKGCG